MASFSAQLRLESGHPRVFSGENMRLKCSIPDEHRSSWSFLWFKDGQRLSETSDTLNLWWMHMTRSGKYSCQGWRDTAIGNLYTQHSLPLEVQVDGGYAILEVPQHHGLVGHSLQLTCRTRGNQRIQEVILYKDGVELMSQSGAGSSHFNLSNVSLKEQGWYTCRASWDANGRTHSVISVPVMVEILEVLTEPVLEIADAGKLMKLVCHVKLNSYGSAPPINYYFYKDEGLMGPATSDNHSFFKRSPGLYKCRAKVPMLGIFRWSKSKRFDPQ